MSKWNRTYWADLGERVASTALYGLVTMLTSNQVVGLDWQAAWVVIGLPTVLSLVKGLLANMADPTSGASLVPATRVEAHDHDAPPQGW